MRARARLKTFGGRPRRAFVLIGTLIVIMLASMIAISLMFQMRVEEKSTAAGIGSEQAWAAAMGGVRKAMRAVATNGLAGINLRDDPGFFRSQLVFDDGSEQWRFSVYSTSDDLEAPVLHGLSDEAGKLNVNHVTEAALERFPGLEPLLSHALLDFIDKDGEPHPEGAEQAYYDTLTLPYQIHNGPLATVDELLLVRGFTKAVLYGEDANLNRLLDANEDDGDLRFPPDDEDGALNPGLYPFLTVSSYEPNRTLDGRPRVSINDASASLPTNGLPEGVLTFVAALRRNKTPLAHPAALLEGSRTMPDESGRDTEYLAGVGEEELPAVLDLLSSTNATELFGLINVNTASATVLQTVPGIDESLAEALVSARSSVSEEDRRTTAWPFTESLVDAEEFKEIAPFLTARGFQYHFRVVGYGVVSRQHRILEVIIDAADGTPKTIYLRDVTRLGLPFPLDNPDETGLELAGEATL
jgi:hypothetical protein